MRNLVNYFFRGLLFVFPVFATLYIIFLLINWADDLINTLIYDWFHIDLPGLGLITAILIIVFLGFIVSRAFTKPFVHFFERTMERTPLVKIFYSALKDLTEAFVGDRKKFNKPVIVTFIEGVDRIGFITETDLGKLNLEDRIAVYCPHSYNFSGNLYLVHPEQVKKLDINPADAMKFAVSAGVTHIQ